MSEQRSDLFVPVDVAHDETDACEAEVSRRSYAGSDGENGGGELRHHDCCIQVRSSIVPIENERTKAETEVKGELPAQDLDSG